MQITLKGLTAVLFFALSITSTYAQEFLQNAQVHGSLQTDGQYYLNDSKLGINSQTLNNQRFANNSFLNINYTNENFSAGMRYEAFLNPTQGFSPDYEGTGVPYWYLNYSIDKLDITAGHYYEQFGSGMILRTYEEWALGYDNSLNGIRLKYNPFKGFYVKALVGYQRERWVSYDGENRGIVRGTDAEILLNDFLGFESSTIISLGGSFISKYEKISPKYLIRPIDNQGSYEKYEYELPANVAAWAGRFNITRSGWNLMTEYAYKMNNPSALNNFIYKSGHGLYSVLSYSQKGFGAQVSAKRIDNMGFKSKISEKENVLDINFLPPLTQQHHYSFATMYPYATQPNGEMALQGQIEYTIPRNTPLGGNYGTTMGISYSRVNSIKKESISSGIPIDSTGTLGYTSPFFSLGDDLYYEDLNIHINKKISSKLKTIFAYYYQVYNKDVVQGYVNQYGLVYAHIGVADVSYKITKTNSIRLEMQMLFTEQDKGNWAGLTAEYSIAPNWFFSISDEYNFGNKLQEQKLHYYNAAVGYTHGTTRIALSAGRQREGLLCVGGVCRFVPASNGLTLTVTSSF